MTTLSNQPKTQLSPSQQKAIDLMQGGASCFLTGMAGTGKTHVITHFIGQAFRKLSITATTGIAALTLRETFRTRTGIPIQTYTIHRWSGIALGPKPGQDFQDYFQFLCKNRTRSRQAAFNRIDAAECLVIDEISMLPGRILDYLDFHCQQIRGNSQPFGGIQLIAVGDYLQLPPVTKSRKHDWAFNSKAWKGAHLHNIYLKEIFRQKDPTFTNALNAFREGRVDRATMKLLNSRIALFPKGSITRLYTHNAQVNKWNKIQLDLMPDAPSEFEARTQGPPEQIEFLKKNLVTPEVLTIKRNARVMVTANIPNPESGDLLAVNGDTGTVMDVPADGEPIPVQLDGGRKVLIERFDFSFDSQDPKSAILTQYPLRLAYAATIHKCQGLTLDEALIDIRAAREPGQAYVALSRVKSLEGLHLKDTFKGVFVSNEALNFYKNI